MQRKSKHKGPKAGECLVCWRNSEEAVGLKKNKGDWEEQ